MIFCITMKNLVYIDQFLSTNNLILSKTPTCCLSMLQCHFGGTFLGVQIGFIDVVVSHCSANLLSTSVFLTLISFSWCRSQLTNFVAYVIFYLVWHFVIWSFRHSVLFRWLQGASPLHWYPWCDFYSSSSSIHMYFFKSYCFLPFLLSAEVFKLLFSLPQ